MNTIFVQIAFYKNPELTLAALDLVAKAKHPENLHICIACQHAEDENIEMV